jgi:hypothetical protein
MATLRKLAFLVVLVGLASAFTARADELFDNLGNAGLSADPTGDVWGPLADSFSTGSTPFDFTSLTVLLSGTAGAGSTTAYLLSDSSTTPGTILEEIGTFSELGLSNTPADCFFGADVDHSGA